jgi:hypothetical protein
MVNKVLLITKIALLSHYIPLKNIGGIDTLPAIALITRYFPVGNFTAIAEFSDLFP